MKHRSLLLLAFLLSACAHRKTAPKAPTEAAAPAAPAPDEQLARAQKAQSLRDEAYRLLHSKDPRVKNPSRGFALLQEAAELGDPISMDTLGGLHASGQAGARRSCPRAMEWFERSASAGYGLAANNLAYLLLTCEDRSRRDPAKAEAILKSMFAHNPSMIAVLDTYATLLAEQGNFPMASRLMESVIELQEFIESNPERIDESRQALSLYRKKKKLATGFDAKPESGSVAD